MKKGSTITGVVKKVQRAENTKKARGNASAQSMIELAWSAPELSGAASQHLNLALQSVIYTNPLYARQQQEAGESGFPAAAPRPPAPARATGGLLSGVGEIAGGAASTIGAGVAGTGAVAHTQSVLATPPTVLPANPETTASLQSAFGLSSSSLFHTGSGQAISSGGTAASMDIFSQLSNDAVITSPSRDFEISAGAQMLLLVQARN
jgi:hypothetical protein